MGPVGRGCRWVNREQVEGNAESLGHVDVADRTWVGNHDVGAEAVALHRAPTRREESSEVGRNRGRLGVAKLSSSTGQYRKHLLARARFAIKRNKFELEGPHECFVARMSSDADAVSIPRERFSDGHKGFNGGRPADRPNIAMFKLWGIE